MKDPPAHEVNPLVYVRGNYIDLPRGLTKQHKHPFYFVEKHPPPLKLTPLKES